MNEYQYRANYGFKTRGFGQWEISTDPKEAIAPGERAWHCSVFENKMLRYQCFITKHLSEGWPSPQEVLTKYRNSISELIDQTIDGNVLILKPRLLKAEVFEWLDEDGATRRGAVIDFTGQERFSSEPAYIVEYYEGQYSAESNLARVQWDGERQQFVGHQVDRASEGATNAA